MTIHVINPNSLRDVTKGIEDAIDPMRATCPVAIKTHTLEYGPPGIETQAHVDLVVAPLLARAEALRPTASAFVIACYSDPGLASLREQEDVPIFGIAEAAILTAMTLGQRFGVISIGPASIPRHMRALGAMGVTGRLAGDLALNLSVKELSNTDVTRTRLLDVGTRLRDTHGAEVLILGCAGMAQYRWELAHALRMPVIDPCQAATAMAIGALALERAQKGGSDEGIQ
jgi:allantoin racemase